MTEPTDKERRKGSRDALREAAAMLSAVSGVKLAWGKLNIVLYDTALGQRCLDRVEALKERLFEANQEIEAVQAELRVILKEFEPPPGSS